MKKAYAEKRFFEWHEDELAVSLRAKSGSYGGAARCLCLNRIKTTQEQKTQKSAPVFQRLWEMGGLCADDSRGKG